MSLPSPNQITLARMALVPVIALLICMQSSITAAIAFVLFILAAASDWYDGYLARRTNSTSLFGRIFDANADKLLTISCLLALASNQQLKMGLLILPALVIVAREILVSGLREYVALNAAPTSEDEATKATRGLQSSQMGKLKTVVQMVAIGLTIPVPYIHALHPYLGFFAGLTLWVAAGLSIYSGIDYWKVVRHTPERTE